MFQADWHLSGTSAGCKDHPGIPSSSAREHEVDHAARAGHEYAPQSISINQHTLHQLLPLACSLWYVDE